MADVVSRVWQKDASLASNDYGLPLVGFSAAAQPSTYMFLY